METIIGYQTGSYMNAEQAAEYLAVSIHTLRQWVSKSKVPYYKIKGSNQVRFRREDLDEWMMQGFRGASIAADRKEGGERRGAHSTAQG